jgi:hypothetical protein
MSLLESLDLPQLPVPCARRILFTPKDISGSSIFSLLV